MGYLTKLLSVTLVIKSKLPVLTAYMQGLTFVNASDAVNHTPEVVQAC